MNKFPSFSFHLKRDLERAALCVFAALLQNTLCLSASGNEVVVEDAAARAALPEFQTLPAAPTSELTPAQGWPSNEDLAQWTRSLGGPSSARYSSLKQINSSNVKGLQVAWTYNAGDRNDNVQCNPIVVDGILYTPTPGRQIAAIDAATGKELWKSDIGLAKAGGFEVPARRGLLYWPGDANNAPHIIFPGGRSVISIDAKSGKLVDSFGTGGKVKMPAGATAGGAVWKNVLVMPGYERDIYGFDVISGKELWTFKTVAEPGQTGGDSWANGRTENGANCWGGIALDEPRGIVYFTTGSPKPNFDGTRHLGDNLFSNCLVALKASTGEYLWHVQEIRHDIWDLDLPAPPNLVTVEREGKRYDAVSAVSKTGVTLLVDRVTGKHLFPFRLRRAPTSKLPGEVTAPYQPFPELPEPFSRVDFRKEDITERTPEAKAFVELMISRANYGWYEPFELNKPTIFYSTHGGAEWTGAAADLPNGRLYVTVNHVPAIITVFRDDDPAPVKPPTPGEQTYTIYCAVCHGLDRRGVGHAPPLRGLRHRMKDDEIRAIWKTGRGGMPPQPQLTPEQQQPLIDFLLCKDRGISVDQVQTGTPPKYSFAGYHHQFDQESYPGSKPPWGTLACLDLNSGKKLWQVPLGEYPELTAKGFPKTGTENFGGATVTAGNVVFASGTRDGRIYAFDATTGAELWSAQLPFVGSTAPMTYQVNGRQYVVIPATGGGKLNAPPGDAWVAFALPE
jgi:quinoprotein glucose dehydrogenase